MRWRDKYTVYVLRFFFYQSLALNFLFAYVRPLLFMFSGSTSSDFLHCSLWLFFCPPLSTVSSVSLIISPFRFSASHIVRPVSLSLSLSLSCVSFASAHIHTHSLSHIPKAKWTHNHWYADHIHFFTHTHTHTHSFTHSITHCNTRPYTHTHTRADFHSDTHTHLQVSEGTSG